MKKFAKVYWTVQDVHDARRNAENPSAPVSDEVAAGILASIESDLEDAMIQAGWAVLEGELA